MTESPLARCGRDDCGCIYNRLEQPSCPKCGNTAQKLRVGDPALDLLDKVEPTKPTVHRKGCYICEDSEYSRLGMPLCYPCSSCGGHVPADDCVCDDCKKDQRP